MIKTIFTLLTGSILLGYSSVLCAGTVSGYVTDDNGDPVPGLPVSDGISVSVTGEDGKYLLDLQDGQPFIFIHLPDGTSGYPWFHRKPVSGGEYSFVIKSLPDNGIRSFIQVADTETSDMSWLPLLHGYYPDFILHSGDICRSDGIPAHAAHMTEEAMGSPIVWSIGNHDIVDPWDGDKTYADYMPPYYYSFDWGPYLVIVAPMWGGDSPLPYHRESFGDWLVKITEVLPQDKPILFFCHALWFNDPDFLEFPGFDGRSYDLAPRLAGWWFGHYHNNRVIPLKNGAKAFGTAVAQKGGIAHSPSCTREVWLDENDDIRSRMHWNASRDLLHITAPSSLGKWQHGDKEYISAVNWNKGNPVENISAEITSGEKTITVPLTSTGNSWTAELPVPSENISAIKLTAQTRGDRAKEAIFTDFTPTGPLNIKWIGTMDTEAFLAAPVAGDGMIFTGGYDIHESTAGGVYAWDQNTGECLWKFTTVSSVNNNMAFASGIVYAQDDLGTLYALSAADGSLIWMQESGTYATSGLCVKDGTVYAGYANGFSAYDAATGEILWRRTDWSQGEASTCTIVEADGVLVFGANWKGLFGFNAADGTDLWKVTEGWMPFQGAASLFHEGKIYAKGERNVCIIDPASGKIISNVEVPGSLQSAAAPVITGDILVVTGIYDIFGLDKETLELKWRTSVEPNLIETAPYSFAGKTVESTPVLWNGLLWFGANDGNLYAIDPASGAAAEKYFIGSPVFSAPLATGDCLYLADFSGRVICLERQ